MIITLEINKKEKHMLESKIQDYIDSCIVSASKREDSKLLQKLEDSFSKDLNISATDIIYYLETYPDYIQDSHKLFKAIYIKGSIEEIEYLLHNDFGGNTDEHIRKFLHQYLDVPKAFHFRDKYGISLASLADRVATHGTYYQIKEFLDLCNYASEDIPNFPALYKRIEGLYDYRLLEAFIIQYGLVNYEETKAFILLHHEDHVIDFIESYYQNELEKLTSENEALKDTLR